MPPHTVQLRPSSSGSLTPRGGHRRPSRLSACAARLHSALAEPFEVEGSLVHVRASVGSARFPDDTVSVGELLELADRRMYAEKLAAA